MIQAIDERVTKGFFVSCQPVDNGPMDDDYVVVKLAQAAIAGGAEGLRIEGAARLAKVRAALPNALIIGIVKRDLDDSPVRITPYLEDTQALADAGADIIAIDATARKRPVDIDTLINNIHQNKKLVMADCSNLADARYAHQAGATIIGSTLSGYTGGPVPDAPDFDFLTHLVAQYPRVMAEGRFNTPKDCATAKQIGAWAVTVGTAITRTEVVTQWFGDALAAHQTPKVR